MSRVMAAAGEEEGSAPRQAEGRRWLTAEANTDYVAFSDVDASLTLASHDPSNALGVREGSTSMSTC